MKPKFFAKATDFRKWLAKNHATETELLVGFYKTKSGKPSMTWPESVDQALCYGWIDGVRHSLGEDAYTIRFTPRRPTSVWSAVNIRKMKELTEQGLMQPAGLAVFEKRDPRKGGYSYDYKDVAFDKVSEKEFRAHRDAWRFFQAQPPGYRKLCTRWVTSAKREETRKKRLAELIADSSAGRRIRTF
jgi:uncharacterized protein YdeI (YjbR/CyaY-like superfamily)